LETNCTIYGGLYEWASAMNIDYSYNNKFSQYYQTSDESCNPCGPTTGNGGIQGICPLGYHIPSWLEWNQYEYSLESTISPTGTTTLAEFQAWSGGSNIAGVGPGSKMKANSSNNPSWDGTNASGFTALPAGFYFYGSVLMGTYAYFRSTMETMYGIDSPSLLLQSGNNQTLPDGAQSKQGGSSVRCIKD
jgi:uncharacterized protein (TIGR02145 family)